VLKFLLKQSKPELADDCLSSTNDEDILQTNEDYDCSIDTKETINLCEIIFKYLNDFLLINNSYLLNKESETTDACTSSSSTTAKLKSSRSFFSLSTESDLDFKLTTNFNQFINCNSIKLNRLIIVLCHEFKMPLNIAFCSQLILFQELNNSKLNQSNNNNKLINNNNSTEQIALCKSITDEINLNNIKENSFILDILLELYLKSSVFRFALNDVATFHSVLIECLNDYFERNLENITYLELLLDLVFVYFYFNRKVYT